MTRLEIIEQFREAVELTNKLRHQYKRRGAPMEFVTEAAVRIPQLLYLLTRFQDIERERRWRDQDMAKAVAEDPSGHVERASDLHQASAVLELYGEAFYFFAWRIRDVLRQIEGFGRFDPVGVRDVRNWLIEHPEQGKAGKPQRGVMARTFIFDLPQGLILKPYGGGAGRVYDRGLFPNAGEFVSDLLPRLRNAVSARS